jgi:hypothetical protein
MEFSPHVFSKVITKTPLEMAEHYAERSRKAFEAARVSDMSDGTYTEYRDEGDVEFYMRRMEADTFRKQGQEYLERSLELQQQAIQEARVLKATPKSGYRRQKK